MGCHVLVVTGEGQRTFTLNFLANIYADMPLSETVSEGIKRCATNQIRDIIMRVGGDLETIRQAVEDGLDLHDYKYSPFVEMVEMEKRLGQ